MITFVIISLLVLITVAGIGTGNIFVGSFFFVIFNCNGCKVFIQRFWLPLVQMSNSMNKKKKILNFKKILKFKKI